MRTFKTLSLALLFTSTLALGCTQNRWRWPGNGGNCQNGNCQVSPVTNGNPNMNYANANQNPNYRTANQNVNPNQPLPTDLYNTQSQSQAPASTLEPNKLPQVPPAPAAGYNSTPASSMSNLGYPGNF